MIDGDIDGALPELLHASEADVKDDIIILNKLARALYQRRLDSGCLELQRGKRGFNLDPETMAPQDCYIKGQHDARQLVQELMLLASTSVAEFVYNTFEDSSLLHCNAEPKESKFAPLIALYKSIGVRLDGESTHTLAASVRAYAERSRPIDVNAMQVMLSRV